MSPVGESMNGDLAIARANLEAAKKKENDLYDKWFSSGTFAISGDFNDASDEVRRAERVVQELEKSALAKGGAEAATSAVDDLFSQTIGFVPNYSSSLIAADSIERTTEALAFGNGALDRLDSSLSSFNASFPSYDYSSGQGGELTSYGGYAPPGASYGSVGAPIDYVPYSNGSAFSAGGSALSYQSNYPQLGDYVPYANSDSSFSSGGYANSGSLSYSYSANDRGDYTPPYANDSYSGTGGDSGYPSYSAGSSSSNAPYVANPSNPVSFASSQAYSIEDAIKICYETSQKIKEAFGNAAQMAKTANGHSWKDPMFSNKLNGLFSAIYPLMDQTANAFKYLSDQELKMPYEQFEVLKGQLTMMGKHARTFFDSSDYYNFISQPFAIDYDFYQHFRPMNEAMWSYFDKVKSWNRRPLHFEGTVIQS